MSNPTGNALSATEELSRLRELEVIVKSVLAQRGDDVCWLDVYTQMAELVGVKFDPQMLPRDQMLKNCEHFVDCLLTGRPYRASRQSGSLSELEKEGFGEAEREGDFITRNTDAVGPCVIEESNGSPLGAICILTGGPEFDIQANGKRYHFEMHPYCGPTLVNRHGDPLKHQPIAFLKAASLWAQQGQRVENGLCIWYHKPKPILQHLGGRNYKLVGEHPSEKGE